MQIRTQTGRYVLATWALALAVTVLPARAQAPPEFVLAWGGAGVKPGNLMAPRALALDAKGNLYVPDKSGRLQKFSSAGKALQEWGGPDDFSRLFQDPMAAVIASDGTAIVADQIMIRRYDASGESTDRWPAGQPLGMAMTKQGAFYVTDGRGQRVLLFEGSGNPKVAFGRPGSGDGELSSPSGIALDAKGNIFVADTGNNRVQKFAAAGTYVAQWGAAGTGPGQFDSPQGIAIDKAGDVYVVDQGNARVQKFTPEGEFILQWGTPGTGNGQFDSPTGIAVDKLGNIYVADTGNNRIQKFAGK
jgi:DNA-binding beta-propeller fold protein YncE